MNPPAEPLPMAPAPCPHYRPWMSAWLVLAGFGFAGMGCYLVYMNQRHADRLESARLENATLRADLNRRDDRWQEYADRLNVDHAEMLTILREVDGEHGEMLAIMRRLDPGEGSEDRP